MRTTRHILNHRSGMFELVLDEDSGVFDLRFRAQQLFDLNVRGDVERWCRQIGKGWARRTGTGCDGGIDIDLTQLGKGSYMGSFKLKG